MTKLLLTRRPGGRQCRALTLLLFCAVGATRGAAGARADDSPTLNKASIVVDTWQSQGYWKPGAKEADFSHTSWIPRVKFSVKGPVPGGAQFSVDFTRADGSLWQNLLCPTTEIKDGAADDLETRHDDADTKKGTTAIGVFGFKIRLSNELTNQNQVLFTGKFKVGRVDKSNGIAKFANKYDFYVNHDWLMPMGYVWFPNPDDALPMLAVGIWSKGELDSSILAAYLFYKGKQVASTKGADDQTDISTSHHSKGDPMWRFSQFTFRSVHLPDPKQADGGHASYPDAFFLDKNPGEYDFKVLADGHIYRDLKFTIGADGKMIDPLEEGGKLGSRRHLVPVKVAGTLDLPWNKAAWKTEAFYGNPVPGFEAP